MNKKELLSEELKRHQQLLEYSLQVPEETDKEEKNDLIKSSMTFATIVKSIL